MQAPFVQGGDSRGTLRRRKLVPYIDCKRECKYCQHASYGKPASKSRRASLVRLLADEASEPRGEIASFCRIVETASHFEALPHFAPRKTRLAFYARAPDAFVEMLLPERVVQHVGAAATVVWPHRALRAHTDDPTREAWEAQVRKTVQPTKLGDTRQAVVENDHLIERDASLDERRKATFARSEDGHRDRGRN